MATIGVDLGGTNIRAGIRIGNEITRREETSLKEKDSLESTLRQLKELISKVMSPDITGLGVAVPSIVDAENGVVYNVVNIPSWERVELKSILEETFKLPVRIENDANCFALGEHRHGKARGVSNMVGITLGTGVGSGVVLNNRLYSGSNGGAGEIGYLNYLDRDFEFYGGSFFFAEVHKSNARDLSVAARAGDARALNIWKEYGSHIGAVIKSVVYAFDPEAIVFGGSISKAYELFEPSMREAIAHNFYFPGSMQKLKIFQSENENINLLGASSLVDERKHINS